MALCPLRFPIHQARSRDHRSIARPIANHMIYTDSQKTVYTVSKVDSAKPPTTRGNVCFDVDVTLGAEGQRIFIGLLETAALGLRQNSPGIGISIDPTTGAIVDVVNDQGVIGFLEEEELHPGRTLPVRVEVEILNQVCLPKLTICGESFLHPALFLGSPSRFSALVGSAVVPQGRARFEGGALRVEIQQDGLPA
jgi:hypothetical protein